MASWEERVKALGCGVKKGGNEYVAGNTKDSAEGATRVVADETGDVAEVDIARMTVDGFLIFLWARETSQYPSIFPAEDR